jgi:hypothetical protein
VDTVGLKCIAFHCAAEVEAARIATQIEATRIATEVEAARIAAKIEADRIAVDVEAAMIAAAIARRDALLAAKVEAARLSAAESASAHRPVEQSKECKQAEKDRYEFVLRMIILHDIWYLQEKTADKSPPHQALPARAAMLLGKSHTLLCCALCTGVSRREELHRPVHRWPNMQDEQDHL